MKVGLCGLGDRLGYLAPVFERTIPAFNVIAYADPCPAALSRLIDGAARRLRGYATLERMLEREALDLVMIGSPNRFHYEQLRLVLDAGVRAFCEKPVVVSEAQTFALLEALGRYGTERVLVGLVLRYAPVYADLVRLADEGVLGEIVSLEACEHIEPAHGGFFHRDWRRKTALSGGFLLEKCCHDLDLYAGLVRSRARRVASFGGQSIFTARHHRLTRERVYRERTPRWGGSQAAFSGDADIVDHQVALIEYENGARLAFHTNLNAPDERRRFCVVGTEGMAEGDFVRGELTAHRAASCECVFDAKYDYDEVSRHYGAERQMAADLARHLECGAPLPVSVLDGLAAGLTALKIDEARERGEVVDLAGLWRRFDALAPAATDGVHATGKRAR